MLDQVLTVLAEVVNVIAHMGAGAASTILGFQPELPEELHHEI